ncbi:MAG: hypothetical protein K8S99_05060 [Planctomycetes bacterium]|nr:hypothetical protein [Planctomycetota bacterium]
MAKQSSRVSHNEKISSRSFYSILKSSSHKLDATEVVEHFKQVNQKRVQVLSALLSSYLTTHLPAAINKRNGLEDYRSNPYVLLASAHIMDLADAQRFADFLFNTKLYMGLETSFGKSIEAAFVSQYPLNPTTVQMWTDPPEKGTESKALGGLAREEKAAQRTESVWREIDKACVVADRRYMTSIKSGPNCINDTQVAGMTDAIAKHHLRWFEQTKKTYPKVKEMDLIIGLTYGTDKTTNNKENQILVKLLTKGFVQEDPHNKPGVLIDAATRTIRVYRRVGKDFWSMIGDPAQPSATQFVFLEILLALAHALTTVVAEADLETKINSRIQALIMGLKKLMFPRKSLPEWVRKDFNDVELFWFATALTSFYDEGI